MSAGMGAEALLEKVIALLKVAGFSTSERVSTRPRSFDVAARRDEVLVFLKCLHNIDSLSREAARELVRVASCLMGSAFVVGEMARNQPIEQNVVYMRYGVPVVSFETLYDSLIEGTPPLLQSEHGGLYASINGKKLHMFRVSRNMSIGSVAQMLGVSRRTVKKYEEEEMKLSVEVALKLEELFDAPLVMPVDFLRQFHDDVPPPEPCEMEGDSTTRYLFELLRAIGFEVLPTRRAPFTALSKEHLFTMLTAIIRRPSQSLVRRAKLMSSISEVVGTESVCVMEKEPSTEHIEKTAILATDELKKVDDPVELLILIRERVSDN
ncbi:MAG: transcriptional regulator [Methermicoccaceae archaeon]